MHIFFHAFQLGLRGTEVAIFDYARYNQEILNNRSTVIYNAASAENVDSVVQTFRRRFQVFGYSDFSEVQGLAERQFADLFYILKSGRNDGKTVTACPNAVHAVFASRARDRHGERYAFISQWLAEKCSGGQVSFVPHMIDLPDTEEDMRSHLGIPRGAAVIGSYGGETSFNVPFAPSIVARTIAARSDLWFLFMNFKKFMDHPRVLFLQGNSDRLFKARLMNTCDAMLHARAEGETFGLACGEFSSRNKPVMTYGRCRDKCQIKILGNKGWIYESGSDLERMVLGFDRTTARNGDWDCYTATYNPRAVMAKFDAEFIRGGATRRKRLGEVFRTWLH